jgi:NlpC/P60 family putative phage cell wall peptidase
MPTDELTARIFSEARKWLGTPWHHQARVRGVGVDCGGLLIEVFKAVGILPVGYDVGYYGRQADIERLVTTLSEHAREAQDVRPGDVLLFTIVDAPRHLAIATDRGMIHSWQGMKAVVEHNFDKRWQRRLYKIYRPEALWQP